MPYYRPQNSGMPILYLFMSVGPLILFLWTVYLSYHHSASELRLSSPLHDVAPGYVSILLRRIVLMIGMLIFSFVPLYRAKRCWFLTYRYRITESAIEARNSITGKIKSVSLADVKEMREIKVLIGRKNMGATAVYMLKDTYGKVILLPEGVPGWEDARRLISLA